MMLRHHKSVDYFLGSEVCHIVLGESSLPVSLKVTFFLCPYKACLSGSHGVAGRGWEAVSGLSLSFLTYLFFS